jgi:hypothetical protein
VQLYQCPIATLAHAARADAEFVNRIAASFDWRHATPFDELPAVDIEAYQFLAQQKGYLDSWYIKEGHKEDDSH